MDKFTTLCSPNIRNLVALFKHHLDNKRYIDNIIGLKFKSVIITFRIIVILDKCMQKKCSSLRCIFREIVVVMVWWKGCNLGAILKHVGSCLIISNMLDGWPWLATCMIQFTILVCDMQSKDIEVQSVMWRKLNKVIIKKGVPNPNFMANGAQAKLEHGTNCVWLWWSK